VGAPGNAPRPDAADFSAGDRTRSSWPRIT